MDIDDESMFALLRSSRERVRQSPEDRDDVQECLLKSRELISQSIILLRNGKTSATLNIYRDSNHPPPSSVPQRIASDILKTA